MTYSDYRPAKLTREQQRQLKQRNKDFDAALKREARLSNGDTQAGLCSVSARIGSSAVSQHFCGNTASK
jgi:hypothetical protein